MKTTTYWVVIRCPACGRLTRGNAIQRALDARQRDFFDDMQGMPVSSGGYRKIVNKPFPLWPNANKIAREIREPVADLLEQLGRRLRDAAYEAEDAARRMRYL